MSHFTVHDTVYVNLKKAHEFPLEITLIGPYQFIYLIFSSQILFLCTLLITTGSLQLDLPDTIYVIYDKYIILLQLKTLKILVPFLPRSAHNP